MSIGTNDNDAPNGSETGGASLEINQRLATWLLVLLLVLELSGGMEAVKSLSYDSRRVYRVCLNLFTMGFGTFLIIAAWFAVYDLWKGYYFPRVLRYAVLCAACWAYCIVLFVCGNGPFLWPTLVTVCVLVLSQSILLCEAVKTRKTYEVCSELKGWRDVIAQFR
jgi:hypothetical protein